MSRNPYLNDRMQNFWKEAVRTETKARLLAFTKLRGQPRSQSRQFEVCRKKIEDSKPSDDLLERLPPIHSEDRHITQKADLNEVREVERAKAEVWKDVPQMRPVPALVKRTLYDGISKEGKGRDVYLRQRYDKNPEDKFSFPLCTSWDYGWRLNDVAREDGVRKSIHGRFQIIKDSFYFRNGVANGYNIIH